MRAIDTAACRRIVDTRHQVLITVLITKSQGRQALVYIEGHTLMKHYLQMQKEATVVPARRTRCSRAAMERTYLDAVRDAAGQHAEREVHDVEQRQRHERLVRIQHVVWIAEHVDGKRAECDEVGRHEPADGADGAEEL